MFKYIVLLLALFAVSQAQIVSVYNNTKCLGKPIASGGHNACTSSPIADGYNVGSVQAVCSGKNISLTAYPATGCTGTPMGTASALTNECIHVATGGLANYSFVFNQTACPTSFGWKLIPGFLVLAFLLI